MSDSAFKSAPYSGYTTAELEAFLASELFPVPAERATAMRAEIARRAAVAAGDWSQMTDGERLRYAQAAADAIRQLNRVNDYLATVSEDGIYESMCMAFDLIDAARADVHNAHDTSNFPSQVANVLALFDIRIARDQAEQTESAPDAQPATPPTHVSLDDIPTLEDIHAYFRGDIVITNADQAATAPTPAAPHRYERDLNSPTAACIFCGQQFRNPRHSGQETPEDSPAVGSDPTPMPNPNITPDAPAQTGAVGVDLATSANAVLVINTDERTRVAGMAAYLTLSGVPHIHETVGLLATITVLRADVAYVLDSWHQFRTQDAAGMIAQLAEDKAAGVTVWPVEPVAPPAVGAEKLTQAELTEWARNTAAGMRETRAAESATESPAPAIRVVLATRTRVLALCEQLDLFMMLTHPPRHFEGAEPVYRLVAPSEQKLATATMPAEYAELTRSNVLAMVERLGLFVVVDPAKFAAGDLVYRLRADVAVVQSEPEQQQQERDDDDDAPSPESAPASGPGPYIAFGSCCDDCVQAIANGDYTGMDDATERAVRKGIAAVGQSLITDAWDVIKQVVRDCAGTESAPLMLGNVELWIDSADGSLIYSLPVAAWDMASVKRDLAERLTIIANNTRGRARLGGEIVAALAAVVARVTFSNLLTKEQVLYVYRHTGILAEELPKKPGEVLRKRLTGEDAGVVVRFSRHHQKSTYEKPLWLCEHIVGEPEA